MANTLLTIDMITKESVANFLNTNAFIKNVSRQYTDEFAREGAKIGSTLRIRLPADFTVRTGNTVSYSDVTDKYTSLTVATLQGVDMNWTGVEKTLSIDDYRNRYIKPAMNRLAGEISATIIAGMEGNVSNRVVASSGGATSDMSINTVLKAVAALRNNSAPSTSPDDIKLVTSPDSNAKMVGTMSGLFNNARKISQQFDAGVVSDALGATWFIDQSIANHTAGTLAAGGATVNGASQTGSTLTLNAISGTIKKGDVFTLAGVFAINRITKAVRTGVLQQFVATADVANLGTSISFYPPITPGTVAYATCSASPANGAALVITNNITAGTSETTVKNLMFHKDAVQMVTADLPVGMPAVVSSREMFDGVSMRLMEGFDISANTHILRSDILWGYAVVRPEWMVEVADKLS